MSSASTPAARCRRSMPCSTRQNECPSSEIRLEFRPAVVPEQKIALEQIRISLLEARPVPRIAALAQALVDEREIGDRDGLVVLVGLSEVGGVALYGAAHAPERRVESAGAQMQIACTHMRRVREGLRRKLAALQGRQELLVRHWYLYTMVHR